MVSQQVVAGQARNSIFLVLTVNQDAAAEATVRDFLADWPGLVRSVAFREPDVALNAIIGIGSLLWDRLIGPTPKPQQLRPFREFHGAKHSAPATPGDLLIHLRARRPDLPFELIRLTMEELRGSTTIVDEVHAFRYFDNRDLLGFVDGTENATGQAAYDAVLIGKEDPLFAGGSYVLVQKYTHDLAQWQSLSVEEQERVIGRTKLDDIELGEDDKPANSHVALTDIEGPDGQDIDILRFNMAFGDFTTNQLGTYFNGYASDVTVIEQMLENMFIGSPVGNYDRILDFSTAMTGGTFFIPTDELLESIDEIAQMGSEAATQVSSTASNSPLELGEPAAAPTVLSQQPLDEARPRLRDLGIGSLRRHP